MEEKGSLNVKDESTNPKLSPHAVRLHMLIGPITLFSYLVSLPVLAAAGWIMFMKNYDCEDILRMPGLRIGIGVCLIAVFVISNFVVFYGDRCLIPGFILVMVPLVIILTLGLAISGAYRAESQALPGSPMWMRRRVTGSHHWLKIKRCIYNSRTCPELSYKMAGFNLYDFRSKKLTMIESGCCTPPSICGLEFVNATYWIDPNKPPPGAYPSESLYQSLPFFGGDCKTWSNRPSQLCYDCQTCREGFLGTIRRKWWKLGVFIVVVSVLLTALHIARFAVTMGLQHRVRK